MSILSQDLLDSYGLELQVQINSSGFGGIVFDYENALNFKFAGLLAGTNQVVIGHRTAAGWFFDKVVKQTVTKGVDYQLGVSVHDATVRVMFNGVTVASQTYQGFLNDGRVGLFTLKGASQFDDVFMGATSR